MPRTRKREGKIVAPTNIKKTTSNKKSVRDRLTLKKNTSTASASTIVKSFQQEKGTIKELQLFTNHFDARNKLKLSSSLKRKHQEVQICPFKKEALDIVRSNLKNDEVKKSSPRKQTHSSKMKINNKDRQSIFTGKSISIKAKNPLVYRKLESRLQDNDSSDAVKTLGRTHLTPQKKKFGSSKSLQYSVSDVAVKKPIPAKIIISNLHSNVSENDIRELFGAVGKLKEANLKGIGTAEVIYADSEDAFQAYNKYNTRNLDGQPMLLKMTTVDENFVSSKSVYQQERKAGNSNKSNVKSNNRLGNEYGKQQTFATSKVVFTVTL